MDGTNPKISFIPKGSLVREESFLERRRPRSAIGIIAGTAFVLSIGAYAGLYYYNDSLNKTIAEKTIEIKSVQKEFSDASEVSEAKVFRARADLARELLNAHTVASPVFAFLSKNTTESILYDRFSFEKGSGGSILELSGEAPTYSALAYQADVFRNQTKELSGFSVRDVSLTKFGTVTFTFAMTFAPDYLLYTNNLSSLTTPATEAGGPVATTTTVSNKTPLITASTSPLETTGASTTNPFTELQMSTTESGFVPTNLTDTVVSDQPVPPLETATPTPVAEKQSFWVLFWSKLKFW
jgi:hypothetical protein